MKNVNLNYEGFEAYLLSRENRDFGDRKGVAYRFKFDNDYGASVIKQSGSYGYKDDLWELAVLRFAENMEWSELAYDTPVADDVVGYLTDEEVREFLRRIKKL